MMLLERIEGEIRHKSNHNNPISPVIQLLVAIRFYATGSYLITVADFSGISESSAQRIVHRHTMYTSTMVSPIIAALNNEFIKLLTSTEQIRQNQKKFFQIAKFINVIGCMDCTHIRIELYGGEEAEVYRNRKGIFTINIQTICDSTLKFLDIVAISRDLQLTDPQFHLSADIDLLIGAELFWNLLCVGQIKSSDKHPTLQKTQLGWLDLSGSHTQQRADEFETPRSSGVSLNEALLVGPVVQQDLISILIRFRFFVYSITADIIKMYRQILIHPSQTSLQRILELVTSLTSEAFIAAFKRFISRMGKPVHMYSDNGTTFIGAQKIIKELYDVFNKQEKQDGIKRFLGEQKIHWSFIPLNAPHFGGLWEAGVKSVKHHLTRVVGEAHLTYEEMQTVLCMKKRDQKEWAGESMERKRYLGEKVRSSKSCEAYARVTGIPGYMSKNRRTDGKKIQMVARWRCGNELKGNMYWLKEEERKCRICGKERETLRHVKRCMNNEGGVRSKNRCVE
ncbi:Putative nuclease HARBI1 [Cyphomyrmex costatus]|uniref:Putative nuclease HARBI1 n=1 Tax=Cyphomyrmex costatus TaxID=456900 RepID=A0A151ICK1_9HYME|nr:Putative nuclease HARBI1 [Cyphomyrmex costatus]